MNWQETPIFVTNRNNLDRGFRQLMEWLKKAGMTSVSVIDNDSTYPPLLAYYDQLEGIPIFRTFKNYGPYVLWETGMAPKDYRFIVTDPDVTPAPDCPLNLVQKMHEIANRYQDWAKIGPSLRLDNLPACYAHKQKVLDWEAQFWEHQLPEGDCFNAQIDTTFALYAPGSSFWPSGRYFRLAPPYIFEHLPWYEDSAQPQHERDYYKAHAHQPWINW